MITDRISLNLAYIYLKQFEETIGQITDIEITKTPFDSKVVKGLQRFNSTSELLSYIKQNAPIIPFSRLDCKPLALYEIKAFNVVIDNATRNFVYNDSRVFKTASQNVNKTGLEIMNQSYIPAFIKVLNQFNEIRLNEYILIQYTYIDCGYISTFFIDDYQQLQDLYKKYKSI